MKLSIKTGFLMTWFLKKLDSTDFKFVNSWHFLNLLYEMIQQGKLSAQDADVHKIV